LQGYSGPGARGWCVERGGERLAPSATLTITAGTSGSETKTVGVPAVPPKADIELAIDTTGSMGPSISQAKTDALAIVSGVQGVLLDTQFAVVSFKDSVDGGDEYSVLQSMTASSAAINSAIGGLPAAGGGGDDPRRTTSSSITATRPRSAARSAGGWARASSSSTSAMPNRTAPKQPGSPAAPISRLTRTG